MAVTALLSQTKTKKRRLIIDWRLYMPIKDTVISLLKEKQNQLMEQYTRLEEM